jgi:Mlc titration factor MtfA (ptsG expression regulator)
MKILRITLLICTMCLTTMVSAQETEKKQTTMKTYLIERNMAGIQGLSKEEYKNASLKSCDVLKTMNTNIEWVQSYVVNDKLYCVYKAENKSLIKEHAKKGGFPCDEIMEIKTVIGPFTASK